MPWRTDLLDPIPGDNPSGIDLRYDPIYDKIREARREDDEAPQGDWQHARKVADWPQVIKLAGEALATKSKDLQLAAWLTEAMLKREGFSGLHGGLALMRNLLEKYWDTLYPEMEDGDAELRAAPLAWIGLKLDVPCKLVPLTRAGHSYFQYDESRKVGYEADCGGDYYKLQERKKALEQEGKLSAEEFDKGFNDTPKAFYKQMASDIKGSLDLIADLDRIGDEKFGDAAPSYSSVRKALEEIQLYADALLKRKLEIDPDPIEPEPVEPEPGTVEGGLAFETMSAGGGAAAVAVRVMSPEPSNRDDAMSRIAAAARYLRKEDPTNPAPYLMLRGLRWGEVRASHSPSPKLLEAPATQTRTQLKTLLLESRWADLLEACENAMAAPSGRGWLDLQRYAITACAHLGKEYHAVETALKDALRAYLADVPRLLEMTMMDDTPVANSETQAWLHNEIGFATNAPAATSSADSNEAIELARAGRTEDAVSVIIGRLAQERSLRGRFLQKTRLAAVLVEASQETIAMPILEELLAQIDAYKLEEWEAGEMVAEPLALMHRCLQKLNGDAARRQSLYLRICRLDPLQALNCPT
jgi:type VI secretion system protein ImpA